MSITYPNWKEVAAGVGITLSTRLSNCLRADSITLEKFKVISTTELRKIPNLGETACKEAMDLQRALNGTYEQIPGKYLDKDILRHRVYKVVKELQDMFEERGGWDFPDYLQEFMSYVDFTPNLPLSFRITKDKQGKHSITLQYSKHVLVFVEKPS